MRVGIEDDMALDEYRAKRDFQQTPEPGPEGSGRRAEGRLEYVIQKHDASHLHYDFRLELDGVLKSWAVPKGPSLKRGVKRLAMETEDHPMAYGGFEGVIPQGQYGGGTVMLWDRGEWIPEGDPRAAHEKGRLRFRLKGEKLAGDWVLTRMRPKPGEKKASWLLIKSSDAAMRDETEPDVTEERPLSVATGRDLEEIAAAQARVWDSRAGEVPGTAAGARGGGRGRADGNGGGEPGAREAAPERIEGAERGPLPAAPKAQLAALVSDAPEGDDWLHEIKFDGYRVLCRLDGEAVRVITRNGKDWTDRFPGLVEALSGLPCRSALLDGEVVVLDSRGVSSFQRLQNSLGGARAGSPLLYAFDLLHLDGYDLSAAPIEARKAALAALLAAEDSEGGRVRYSDHVRGQGHAFFENACRMGVEGIISKRAGGPYRGGRNKEWVKTKCTARQEFVVVGFSEPSGSRVGLGALLLGVHDAAGDLVYAGKVGTGFDTDTLLDLAARLSRLERKTPAAANAPRGAKARGVHWVRPALVAEVEFTEWTDDGRIRHPSYQGLREDKAPEDVVREAGGERDGSGGGRGGGGGGGAGSGNGAGSGAAGDEAAETSVVVSMAGGELRAAGVRVTSPDKVLWAEQGVTKRELVEYYATIEEAVLPRLVDRPLTLVRCPSGAESKCFYQKHANDTVPELIPRVPIEEKDGADLYMYVDGLPSLIALVQLGVLEFHIWGSRRDRLDRPDRLVLDLDPDESLPFGRVAAAALRLRELLGELGLESWPKSTGGKGLHVVVPITRRNDWDEARTFTQAIARRLVAEDPDGFTSKMTRSRRTGRIFVDYLRNARNATAIADYSTRARPGAPVAVPLRWDEVNPRARKPPICTIRDVPERLRSSGDPWPGFDDVRQSITKAARDAVGL